MVKLTTEKVMLRNIPQLDLSAFKTSEWINLEEIDLKGTPPVGKLNHFEKMFWMSFYEFL